MIYEIKTGRQIAKFLLDKEAVILKPEQPFTWASGWKSPIYCDNRLLLSFPDVRTFLKLKLSQIVKHKFAGRKTIIGVATAGIPHATLVADQLNLPLAYARKSTKDHGRKNIIEGQVNDGMKVIVVEDLISTGMSSFGVVEKLKEMNIQVAGLIAIFSYAFPQAVDYAARIDLDYYTLSDYNILIEEALGAGYIGKEHIDILNKWRESPDTWSP